MGAVFVGRKLKDVVTRLIALYVDPTYRYGFGVWYSPQGRPSYLMLLDQYDAAVWHEDTMTQNIGRYGSGQHIKADTKWASFCRRLFPMHYLEWKFSNFVRTFIAIYSAWSDWQCVSIGPDNGWPPNGRQTIIWTNNELIHWRIYASPGLKELTPNTSSSAYEWVNPGNTDMITYSRIQANAIFDKTATIMAKYLGILYPANK